MKDRKDISVIIPCFNCEDTIEMCVHSVFDQTYLPSEIILIDDGSSDNTVSKINFLENICPNNVKFTLILQPNSGPSVARNKGIEMASGEWIAFLDSDDYWISKKLEIDIAFLENNKHINILGSTNDSNDAKLITFKMLLFKNYFQTSAVIVRKDVISKIKFNENQKYCEDYRCWLQVVNISDGYVIAPLRSFPISKKRLSYGGEGLSSNIYKMLQGEISNFKYLYRKKELSYPMFFTISSFAILKFFRRLVMKKIFQ